MAAPKKPEVSLLDELEKSLAYKMAQDKVISYPELQKMVKEFEHVSTLTDAKELAKKTAWIAGTALAVTLAGSRGWWGTKIFEHATGGR